MQSFQRGTLWSNVPTYFQQLQELEVYSQQHQLQHLYSIRDRISRCTNLKQKLTEEQKVLKGQLLHLNIEKDVYISMLKNIIQIGRNVDWQPQLLQTLKPAINTVKEQLNNKGKGSSNHTYRKQTQ